MRWLIIGAGVSGLGAAKLLRRTGDPVRVSEAKKLPEAKAEVFRALGVELRDGGHDPTHLSGIDMVVVSPGLPATHPLFAAAKEKGLPILSEIDLALQRFRGKLIAVTGTNGKSTTCAMLGHALKQAGHKVSIGGNYGDPPSAMLAEDRMGDILVLELSSYQLETSKLVRPEVAIFTSFSHDHMARHGSMEGYLAAKWREFELMREGDLAILPHAVAELGARHGLTIPGHTLRVYDTPAQMREVGKPGFAIVDDTVHTHDGKELSLDGMLLKETHNRLNAAFTMFALRHLVHLPLSETIAFLADFRGLPHRCELVGYAHGKPVINDSKSTNVESTLVALQSQRDPVILMLGGQGKGEPYTPLLAEKSRIAAVITFGASGEEIAKDLEKSVPTYRFPKLKDALEELPSLHKKHPYGILFSPACASFDEFDNYEHRGDTFARTVQRKLMILI